MGEYSLTVSIQIISSKLQYPNVLKYKILGCIHNLPALSNSFQPSTFLAFVPNTEIDTKSTPEFGYAGK